MYGWWLVAGEICLSCILADKIFGVILSLAPERISFQSHRDIWICITITHHICRIGIDNGPVLGNFRTLIERFKGNIISQIQSDKYLELHQIEIVLWVLHFCCCCWSLQFHKDARIMSSGDGRYHLPGRSHDQHKGGRRALYGLSHVLQSHHMNAVCGTTRTHIVTHKHWSLHRVGLQFMGKPSMLL